MLQARARAVPGSAAREVEIRRGQYAFRQLADWRDSLDAGLLSSGGVVFTDVDEATNHVTIGVDRAHIADARGKVTVELTRLGIPSAAVTVVETTPMVADVATGRSASAAYATGTLGDPTAPLRGGMEILFPLNGGQFYQCTLGFLMDYQGARRFVTNSHCSGFFFGGDGQAYAQGSDPSYTPYIGSEWHDSHGQICPGYPIAGYPPLVCRESDSNISTTADPAAPGIGTIVRTTYRNGGGLSGGYGSLTIDATSPYFTVTGHEYGVFVGDTLDKMGSSTGWTWGTVQRTCVTINAGNTGDGYPARLTCQHITNYVRHGGDSGAPVFRWSGGNTVVLYGIHRGVLDDQTSAVYSGFRSIEQDEGVQDQGRMIVTAPQSPPNPPDPDPCAEDPSRPGCGDPPCGTQLVCDRTLSTATVIGEARHIRRPAGQTGRHRTTQGIR